MASVLLRVARFSASEGIDRRRRENACGAISAGCRNARARSLRCGLRPGRLARTPAPCLAAASVAPCAQAHLYKLVHAHNRSWCFLLLFFFRPFFCFLFQSLSCPRLRLPLCSCFRFSQLRPRSLPGAVRFVSFSRPQTRFRLVLEYLELDSAAASRLTNRTLAYPRCRWATKCSCGHPSSPASDTCRSGSRQARFSSGQTPPKQWIGSCPASRSAT